jgi:hypothetical protein
LLEKANGPFVFVGHLLFSHSSDSLSLIAL